MKYLMLVMVMFMIGCENEWRECSRVPQEKQKDYEREYKICIDKFKGTDSWDLNKWSISCQKSSSKMYGVGGYQLYNCCNNTQLSPCLDKPIWDTTRTQSTNVDDDYYNLDKIMEARNVKPQYDKLKKYMEESRNVKELKKELKTFIKEEIKNNNSNIEDDY